MKKLIDLLRITGGVDPAILAAFKKEHNTLTLKRTRYAITVSLVFNTLFIATDYFFAADYSYFIILRLIISGTCLALLLFLKAAKHHALNAAGPCLLLLGAVSGLVMVEMARLTEGYESLYSSGYIFIILTAQAIASWHYLYQFTLCAILFFVYMMQSVILGFDTDNISYVTYGWMIIAVGILSTITAYMQYRLRFEMKFKEMTNLRKLHAQKEKLVTANRRLKETQAELIRTETLSAVGELAAGVAHNINNYMSGTDLGLTTVLEHLNDNEKTRTTLATALESVRNTKGIVQTLRDYAKRPTVDETPCDLAGSITSAIRMFRLQYSREAVRIDFDPQQRISVKGHDQQIRSAFLNLLNNACQAGASRIAIEMKKENGRTLVTVADNGAGIPENIRSRIFEPFYTTKDVGGGTGLGLWTVYRTMKDHGGTVSFFQPASRGSEFRLEFFQG